MTNLPFDKPLDNESSRAFEAFTVYRDLGIGRSLDEAYRVDRGHTDSKKSANGTWTNWQTKYSWVERAKAYDAYLLEKARQEREKEHLQELAEYRKALAQSSRLAFSTSIAMQSLVNERLRKLTPEEREKIATKLLPALTRAANDGIEKAMDGWGMALGVDELVEMLDGDD